MKHKHIFYREQEVYYYTNGSGPALVLLHGFGEDSRIWQQQVETLSSRYSLVIPDIPGSGLSPGLAGQPSIDDFAAVVKAILDEEGAGQCIVLGHSMGGYIALALAEKFPQLPIGLGLVHSTAYADSEEKKQARAKSIEFIRANGAAAFLKTSIPGLFSSSFAAANPGVVETLLQQGAGFTVETLTAYYQAMINRPDRTAVLKNLAVPVLFIAGVLDAAVPFAQSLPQLHLPAQCHIHILRSSAHMGMLEETTVVNSAIASFCAACAG